MAKLKKERVDAEEKQVVVPVVEKVVEPESYLVRWSGGEEVFTSKAKAEFAANTHKGGYIVV